PRPHKRASIHTKARERAVRVSRRTYAKYASTPIPSHHHDYGWANMFKRAATVNTWR
ncbi:MAG: hypothetical protein ACJAXH_002700, partial [Colwellia sp.]